MEHREFLLLSGGGLLRVVTLGGELVPWDEWKRRELERSARRCACGRTCAAGSARTCGSRECIDRLAADVANRRLRPCFVDDVERGFRDAAEPCQACAGHHVADASLASGRRPHDQGNLSVGSRSELKEAMARLPAG